MPMLTSVVLAQSRCPPAVHAPRRGGFTGAALGAIQVMSVI